MKTIEMTEATATLAEYARQVAVEPVIVTVGGKPVAALVAIEKADLETVSLSIQTFWRSSSDHEHANRRKVEYPARRCGIGWG